MKAAELKTTLEDSLPHAFPGSTISYKENDGAPESHFGTFNVELSLVQTSDEILKQIQTVALDGVTLDHQSGNPSQLERVLFVVGRGNNAPRITINAVVNDTTVQAFTILIIKPVEEKPEVRIPLSRKPSTTS